MAPQAARSLTIHEHGVTDATFPATRHLAVAAGSGTPLPARRTRIAQDAQAAHGWLLRREALQRRLLGLSDVLAIWLALALVFIGTSDEDLRLVVAAPLVLLLFKIVGLYDGDQMRLVH